MLLCVLGCSSMTVHSNYEEDLDFRQYASFNVDVDLSGTEFPDYLNQLDQAKIRNAVAHEMKKRGYVQQEEGELIATFYLVEKAKKQEGGTNPNVKYYRSTGYYTPGMRGGYYNHRYYGMTEELSPHVEVRHYTEGTLVIDVFDRKKKEMVWQGIAVFAGFRQ